MSNMESRSTLTGSLYSSLSSGFPALPPACLYTLQTTTKELQRLLASIKEIQQQQHQEDPSQTHKPRGRTRASYSQADGSKFPEAHAPGPAPADSAADAPAPTGAAAPTNSPAPANTAAPANAATPANAAAPECPAVTRVSRDVATITHSCIVFSRWTPYSDGSLHSAKWQLPPLPEIPGASYVCETSAARELQKYEAFLLATEQQAQALAPARGRTTETNTQQKANKTAAAAAVLRSPVSGQVAPREGQQQRQEGPPTSLGIIMNALQGLDPAEFLLLFTRMQAQLKSAVIAASSPLPCPLRRRFTSGSGGQSLGPSGGPTRASEAPFGCRIGTEAKDALLAGRMEMLEVPLKRVGGASEASCAFYNSPANSGHEASSLEFARCVIGCDTDTSVSPISNAATYRTAGNSDAAAREVSGSWAGWRYSSGLAYDSIGNEKGTRYFLRESLSQHYWRGLLVDSDSWFEMTVEPIASYMALTMHAHSALQRELEQAYQVLPSFPQLYCNTAVAAGAADADAATKGEEALRVHHPRPLVAVDGCCGAGGDVRQLSRHFDLVLGVDKDLLKVALCRHNTELLVTKENQTCAPVILLHQELQRLASLRGGWSVRDLAGVYVDLKALTLAALAEQQEAINASLLPMLYAGQWRDCGGSPPVEAAPLGARGVPQQRTQFPGGERCSQDQDSSACVIGKGKGKMLATEFAGSGSNCELGCLCVPFSRLPCRLCLLPDGAFNNSTSRNGRSADATLLLKRKQATQRHAESGGRPRDPEAQRRLATAWVGRSKGPVPVSFEAVMPVDWVYMSPPWGGEGYEGSCDFLTSSYFISAHQGLADLIVSAARVAPNVCLFMPRSTDLHEIFVLASLLNFPLVEVEVLYLPSKRVQRRRGSIAPPAVEDCPVYPKAVIIYLVREAQAWVEGRGLPSGYVYERSRQERCRGWRRANGAPKYPRRLGPLVSASWRSKHSLDFAFCELGVGGEHPSCLPVHSISLPAAENQSSCVTDRTRFGPSPTADLLANQGRSFSSPLSFPQLLHSVDAAMGALRGDHALPHPSEVDAALKQGALDVALGAFSALCGSEMNNSLKRPMGKEVRHSDKHQLWR